MLATGPWVNEKIYRKTITKEFYSNLGGGVKVQPGGVGWEVHTNLGGVGLILNFLKPDCVAHKTVGQEELFLSDINLAR